MGARFALHVASALRGEFVAAACAHPGALVTDQRDSPHHDLAGVRGELYVAFAEIDQSATAESVDRFREELDRQRVKGTVERITDKGCLRRSDIPELNHVLSRVLLRSVGEGGQLRSRFVDRCCRVGEAVLCAGRRFGMLRTVRVGVGLGEGLLIIVATNEWALLETLGLVSRFQGTGCLRSSVLA